MSSPETEHLLPNTTDPREMEVFDTIPEEDRQAWLYFLHDSYRKERLGIGPAYTFDQFTDGVAPHIPNSISIVDDIAVNGFRDTPLVKNFKQTFEVGEGDNSINIEPLLTAFDGSKKSVSKSLRTGPLGLVLPHTSLASPYATTRGLIETHGEEIAERIYIVIGPRPAVIQFEAYSHKEKVIKKIPPVLFGRALANVLLTGPDTDSTRSNKELAEWLQDLKRDFWAQMKLITTPTKDGDNNILVFCPAGRVAEEQKTGRIKEFRVDGSLKYLTTKQFEHLSILPVGVYDRLLSDPDSPESVVFVNPDKSIWRARDEDEAQWLHERAVLLSANPLGSVAMESISAQNYRLTKQHIRKFVGKSAKVPYLVE